MSLRVAYRRVVSIIAQGLFKKKLVVRCVGAGPRTGPPRAEREVIYVDIRAIQAGKAPEDGPRLRRGCCE